MKIEFENRSVIECVGTELKNNNVRGQRAKTIYYEDKQLSFKNRVILRYILFKNGLLTKLQR